LRHKCDYVAALIFVTCNFAHFFW